MTINSRNNFTQRKIIRKQLIQVQHRSDFKKNFMRSLANDCNLIIISPFITAIKPWKSINEFAKFFLNKHSGTLSFVTRPPSHDQGLLDSSMADLLSAIGVNLIIRSQPPLHSKIYFFDYFTGDYTAYIGSANFTKGGFENNDESIVKIRSTDHKTSILKEVTRLTGNGAVPYNVWRSRNADQINNHRRNHE